MQRSLMLVVVLLLAAVAPAMGAGSASATSGTAATDGDLTRTMTFHLTPDDPGTIRVVVAYDTPSNLASLSVRPIRGTVTETDGFTDTGRGLRWDNGTADPSFALSITVNETMSGSRAIRDDIHAARESGGYSFVDTGSWAIVPVPTLSSEWTWYGTGTVTLTRESRVAGAGAVGGAIAYLGPQTTYTATGHEQTFRLVVPAAASLTETPDAILGALTTASRMLQVGARDDRVFIVAAPTSVNWGPAGLEYGGSDAWVLANSTLDTVGNVWLHEYVHTRQAYEPTTATQWTVEASAEYYAALLSLQQDRVGFDAFADHLRRGLRSPYASAVLANPYTWTYANYVKGPLVFGNIDRAIRLASDDGHTIGDVLGRMNIDPNDIVTQREFLAAVAAAGSDDAAAYAQRYTETRRVPEVWSRETHAETFDAPLPRLVSSIPDTGVQVAGPYRNETLERIPTLVAGESITVSIDVRNEGGDTGSVSAVISRSGITIDAATATVPPGETATLTVSGTLEAPGTYTLTYGYETRTITVREPATPTVDAAVNRTTVAPGEPIAVTLNATNQAEYPATATYEVVTGDRTRATWTARLAANESTAFTTTLTFSEPGEHTIRIGDRTVTVTVKPAAAGASTPGFGPSIAIAALLAAALLAARYPR